MSGQLRRLAFARARRELRRALHMTAEELRRLQIERLNNVLAVASRAEPYRSRFEDIGNHRVDHLEELARFPVIDRSHLLELSLEDRIPPGRVSEHVDVTSGSSGRPLESAWSEEEFALDQVFRMRPIEHAGLETRRIMNFAFGNNRHSPLTSWSSHAFIGIYVSRADQLAAVLEFQPEVLIATPSLLLDLAVDLEGLRPAGIVTGSEVLTPGMREDLRGAYGRDPMDIYGATETGCVSWQCRLRNYHLNADAVVIEILDERGNAVPAGDVGEVTITTLWQSTTPLVRYRTGDFGALIADPCPCGLPLPLMSQVEGRKDDWVVAADGRRLSPFRFFFGAVKDWFAAGRVSRYRVVQRAVDDFLIEVEWLGVPLEELTDLARAVYSKEVGVPVRVEVRTVERVSNPQSGKFRMVESLVRPEDLSQVGRRSS